MTGRVTLLVLAAVSSTAVLVRGPGAHTGTTVWLVLGGFAAVAAIVGLEAHRPLLPLRAVLAASGALIALAVAVPPVASQDVWSYAAYGRMAAHQISPYTHRPIEFRDEDPHYERIGRAWRESPSVYGPAFTALSAVGMSSTGRSALATRLWFQCLSAGAVLSALAMVAARTRQAGAVALLGLNPLVVVRW